MVNLTVDDTKQVIDLLVLLDILKNEKGREAVLINAGLKELLPHLDLAGPAIVTIPLMFQFFCSYGRLTYEHESLGRFLNTIKSYAGIEQRRTLDRIIARYHLMTPVAISSEKIDWMTPISDRDVLEEIIRENTLRPIAFLEEGVKVARAVAYIEVFDQAKQWCGTGFMLTPSLLLTNHHVLPEKRLLSTAIFRFNYQLDFKEHPQPPKDYRALTGGIYHANQQLDYALVELNERPGDEWGVITLKPQVPVVNNRVNIIQHPNGLPKQISLQSNFVIFANEMKLQYITSTLPGSSGSPVLNDAWEVIGLHHAGGWLPAGESGLLCFRNEGIAIQAILNDFPDEIKKYLHIQ